MKNKGKRIESLKISSSDSILQALKIMDRTFKRLLLVFQEDIFINVLSIGDIQRAIIDGISLEARVDSILREKPLLGYEYESISDIKSKMLANRAECMPVIDNANQLVRIYFWEDFFSEPKEKAKERLDLPVIIMAGGKGTRLKPITNILPKPLIPIGDKSIIELIMDYFVEVGCNDFYISVNYKSSMIRHYFDHLQEDKYRISYIEESKPLGTAGSLYLLKGKITQTFFLTNCDIIINEDYSEIISYHRKNGNDLTIVAALKHYPIPYGTIEIGESGILKSLIEKPELTFKINSGMYVLEPNILDEIPKNTFIHITDLINTLQANGKKIGVFPVSEKSWSDIGTWKDYLDTNDLSHFRNED